MSKILIQGASVTQQSGEEAYVTWLRRELPLHTVQTLAFGGCHFPQAAIVTIEEALDTGKPNIVIFEWNTGGGPFEDHKLKFVVNACLRKSALPIFLILGDDTRARQPSKNDLEVLAFCEQANVPVINLLSFVNPETDLRDNVHTNQHGARKYAQLISRALRKLLEEGGTLRFSSEYFRHNLSVNPLKFLILTAYENSQLKFHFDLDRSKGNHELILKFLHGPDAPTLRLDPSGSIECWDKWSHYYRVGFQSVALVDSQLSIKVSPEEIDYSTCQRPFNFTGPKKISLLGGWLVNSEIKSFEVKFSNNKN